MRKVTIEQFLTWAFTQELCKVGAGDTVSFGFSQAWNVMSEVAVLGTLIDRSPNAYGVIPDFITTTDPHPDAMLAGDAVKALAARGGFEVASDWNPFPEWQDPHGLVEIEVRRVVDELMAKRDALNGRYVVNLVVTRAILDRGLDWAAQEPEYKPVLRFGNPAWFVKRRIRNKLNRVEEIEDDGFDRKKRRPKKGAYRKWEMKGSIRGPILARLDWQLMQDAFATLHSELSRRLHSHELMPFTPNRQPWATLLFSRISSQVTENA
ncbi:hypothetical protein AM571_CH01419 [Rhizobium etli 8C-3]|uniref:Uncharacterized protein n=1 Tax=Rhizobium etli 8C-3 TaxID=538025 RepID=A0A1L5P266_RHIET|nr:hypothetical protein [Rhizobium etli]APO74254.1 hypothetical protein AM571_CH01419 [Rhizobium etli 8C-3]